MSYINKYYIYKPGIGYVRRGQDDGTDPRERDWREESPSWMRPQTPAGRLFDVLSRPNYASANMTLGELRRRQSGQDMKVGDKLMGALVGTTPQAVRDAWRGLSGKDKVFYEDVLNEGEWTKDWHPAVKTVAGLAGDILLDPTTYVGAGVTKAGRAGKVAASMTDDAARLARGLAPVARTAEGLIDTALMTGKSARKATKANKLLAAISGRTGMSVDDLAKAWKGGKVAQSEAGMRGLSMFGQQVAPMTDYYKFAERLPLWLSDTLPAIERSKPQKWIDQNIPIARTGANQLGRAFKPGDTLQPVLAKLGLGARRKGTVEAARLERLLETIGPEIGKAARASGDPSDYMRKLMSLTEAPQGIDDLAKKLRGIRSQMTNLDAMSDVGGESLRFLMWEEQRVADEIAKKLAAQGADEQMHTFAKTLQGFFEKAADLEEPLFQKQGLKYVRHRPEYGHYIPHVTRPGAIDEMGRNPALMDLIPDLSLHDPAQQYRQLRMPAEQINAIAQGTGGDLGTLFGAKYAGMTLSQPLLEENVLVAAKIRGARLKKIVGADEFVEGLKKSGLLRKADEVAQRIDRPPKPGPVMPDAMGMVADINAPIFDVPAGWRTPELTSSAWGTKVNLLDGYVAQSPLAKEIERVWNLAHSTDSQKALLGIYKQALNTWRGYALLGPSYHVRNFASNIWQNFLAGVTDPVGYAQAARFQHALKTQAKDGGAALDAFRLATPFGDLTGRQLFDQLFDEDLMGGFMSEWAHEVDVINESVLATNPVKRGHKWLMHRNLAAGQVIENNARFALYFDTLQKGGSPVDAADAVRKFLFDYSDTGLSKFENDTIRNLTSFYRWTKNNMLLSVEQLAKQPGKYAGIPKVKHAIEGLSEGPPEAFLPEWLAEGYAVRTPFGTSDVPEYFSLQNWLPAMQVAELFEDIDEHHVPGLSWALGMAAPTISLPLEQAMNKSLFFERPIQEYPGQRTELAGIDMPVRLAHLLRTFRPLSEANKFTKGQGVGLATKQFLGGKTYPYDYRKEMRSARFRKMERLAQLKAAWKRAVRSGDKREAARIMEMMAETRRARVVQ